ncbi:MULTISPECIES: hypothetical protein [unclassified Streptomyces]|uniref:hypothetical protein n=1 Tax=unclassified Streptomyces TaxID=2593676 RepID=UPI001BE88D48|nr:MULTISPECIES: hypothetical protein [unclassified Streptomyces]MBT2403468.1 hypothetical protein [Streptomyces sp. ISL-21]MBT2456781.1 hypothetical protein [Streptomyces sp. ISL-86]MBT2612830.1 hypothetical protein [Streptomyces sp. ISL-87]
MSESPDPPLPSARRAPTVPYASYLRVYEPLAAFPEAERAHWADYARRGVAPTAQDELRRSLTDLVRVPVVAVPVHESADAFTAEVGGALLVCPWRTRLRGWLALQELVAEFPRPVLDAALPPGVRRRVTDDYEAWRARNPDARPWIRTGVWQVPLRWFVLVADEEREYLPGERLRYRTPMVQARRRLARGLRTLREADGYAGLAEGLVEVGRWLEEFHPRSMVELDYGGLLHALPADGLAGDRSARDLAAGIAALRAGDAEGAAEAYGELADRWRAVRERLFAN